MKYALLNTSGDPFIFRYWLRFWDREAASRIDQLYVGQSGDAAPEYLQAIAELCKERGIGFRSRPNEEFSMSTSLENAYKQVKHPGKEEDYIVLLQTDCFVFNGQILDDYFNKFDNNNIRLIGETKNSVITYWPNEPYRTDERTVEQIWPCWVVCRASDWHEAYQTVVSDSIACNIPMDRDSPFGCYKGNEEWVTMAHILQSLVPENQFMRVDQERAHHGNVHTAASKFDWFHFGTLEQIPFMAGILRYENNSPIIYGEESAKKHYFPPLKEQTAARNMSTVYTGMMKAIILSGDDHPILQKIQPRYIESLERAISTFNYNRNEVEEYCNLFLGWIK